MSDRQRLALIRTFHTAIYLVMVVGLGLLVLRRVDIFS